MTYLTYNSQLRTETDPATVATLLRKGWVETVPPTYDPSLQHAPEWTNGEWIARDLTEEELAAADRKTWPNPSAFLGEFQLPELAAISLSTDPTIAALRLLLSAWPADVWSDDDRIVLGMARLVEVGILSQERHDEILTP